MSIFRDPKTTEDRVVRRFRKYLNGPLGKTVLENLEEGESFILQTNEHTLRVTKRNGRAVVRLERPVQKELEGTIAIQSR
jgi:hypothetical protein